MENMNKCPGCSHHCDRNNLQCGKGEAYFNGEATPDSGHTHGHHERTHQGHHEGKHKGHCEGKRQIHGRHRPEFPVGSLSDLLAKCGHRLFHGSDESLFAVLTESEQSTLKDLLTKLLGK